jgi:hypothetical protein
MQNVMFRVQAARLQPVVLEIEYVYNSSIREILIVDPMLTSFSALGIPMVYRAASSFSTTCTTKDWLAC